MSAVSIRVGKEGKRRHVVRNLRCKLHDYAASLLPFVPLGRCRALFVLSRLAQRTYEVRE